MLSLLQCRQKTVETKHKCTKCTVQYCLKCLNNRYGAEEEKKVSRLAQKAVQRRNRDACTHVFLSVIPLRRSPWTGAQPGLAAFLTRRPAAVLGVHSETWGAMLLLVGSASCAVLTCRRQRRAGSAPSARAPAAAATAER